MTRPQSGTPATPAAVTSSEPPTTARERRERMLAESSRELQRALCEADVSQGALADAIGRSPSITQRLCDPEKHEALTVADLPLAQERVAVAMLQWAAHHLGYEVRKVHAHDTIADDLMHQAELGSEQAELQAHMLRTIADGHIDRDEAVRGLALIREQQERLDALTQRLQPVVESGASPVRRSLMPVPSRGS